MGECDYTPLTDGDDGLSAAGTMFACCWKLGVWLVVGLRSDGSFGLGLWRLSESDAGLGGSVFWFVRHFGGVFFHLVGNGFSLR